MISFPFSFARDVTLLLSRVRTVDASSFRCAAFDTGEGPGYPEGVEEREVGTMDGAEGSDRGALETRFEDEIRVAGLQVSGEDRERLFAMWEDHVPMRASLRGALLESDEDAAFIQKPAQLPVAAPSTGAGAGSPS